MSNHTANDDTAHEALPGPPEVDSARQASHAHAGPSRQRPAAGADSALVADTGRLFVRNLPFSAAEPDLAELFQEYGELSEVHLVQDRCGLHDWLLIRTC